MTVEEQWRLDEFAVAHSSLSDRTILAYVTDVRLFIDWIGRLHVADPTAVTRTMVRRYVAHLSTREFARRSIARAAVL